MMFGYIAEAESENELAQAAQRQSPSGKRAQR
jgi:hypothetical protein